MSTSGPAEPVLLVVAALEEYRAGLWAVCGEDLVKRLSDPDALELVVELVHDLRSQLNSILFLSEALRSGHSGPVSEHQRSQLGLIYSATLGMVSVANDVMDTAREPEGGCGDNSVLFSVATLLESVEEIVRPMAEEKDVALEFRIEGRERHDRRVGYPSPLTHTLLNLTTNALKFTEEGQVTVCAVEIERDRIEFSVSDSGRGIPSEKLDALFRVFHKSSYRSGHYFSGSGLGLSIARRLVGSMGGEPARNQNQILIPSRSLAARVSNTLPLATPPAGSPVIEQTLKRVDQRPREAHPSAWVASIARKGRRWRSGLATRNTVPVRGHREGGSSEAIEGRSLRSGPRASGK